MGVKMYIGMLNAMIYDGIFGCFYYSPLCVGEKKGGMRKSQVSLGILESVCAVQPGELLRALL